MTKDPLLHKTDVGESEQEKWLRDDGSTGWRGVL